MSVQVPREAAGSAEAPSRAPEVELMLCCSRTRLDPARAARVAALCSGPLDWERLIGEARRHGVDPLLYRHLGVIGPPRVPAEVLDRLHERFETNAVRNRLLVAELGKVLAVLDAHGIPAIPYKGPVLAAAAYGDLALRRFADLDILVARADVLRCKDALRGLGYEPRLRLTPAQEQAYLSGQCEYALDRDRGRLTVEIHWDIVPPDYAFRFDLERLWTTARPVPVSGMTVLAPLPDDLLLMLVVHGSKHLWERLAWLTDVAQVMEANPRLDWLALLEQARAGGGERMLLVALGLTGDLLGIALPAPIARTVVGDRSVAVLVRLIADALLQGELPPERSIRAVRVHLRMRERRRDRLAYLLRVAVTPTIEDWASIRLPAPLLPLHYLLRPFRLVAKHGAAMLRRST